MFTLGLLITCFIAAYQIKIHQIEVGQFSGLVAYMAQLSTRLNSFATLIRSIQSSMINSERMLELFKEHPTVVDKPDAQDLGSCIGGISFSNVHLAYGGGRRILNGLTFKCLPFTTTALVSESSCGKSTIYRLLLHFYNVNQRDIQVDGRNVEEITIDSLRRNIGIVPQDTILPNDSLMGIMRYADHLQLMSASMMHVVLQEYTIQSCLSLTDMLE